MEQEPRAQGQQLTAISCGIVAGALIGLLDLSATEVQGSLLLILVGAFILGVSGRVAPWLAGIAIGAGMVGTHLIAWAVGASNDAGVGSIIAVAPAIAAAYAGRFLGALVGRAADSLPYGRVSPEQQSSEPSLPWYAERGASRALLGAILFGTAVIGYPVVYHALLAAGQPITWWVATIWQILTLVGWIVLTPVVIAHREGKADTLTAESVATTLSQVIGLAMVHAIILVVLTRMMLIPPGDQEMFARIMHAFVAYVPLDVVTFVLLWTLAYVSNADRHLREAARVSAARAASLSAELNSSKLSALRAQLQPHFLFNAINTAVVLSTKGDSAGTASVLRSLSDLLRYVLKEQSEVVNLGEELGFAEQYLTVERARFPDRLSFEIDADEAARDSVVPHLMLQPLVENAVRHGIAGKIAPGKVVIRARVEGDKVVITIEDDGIGIDRVAVRDNGLGIANTRSRLSIMYGSDATFDVTARPSGGTICRIALPTKITR